MTDESKATASKTEPKKQNNLKAIMLIGLVAVVVAVLGYMVMTQSGIDEALVKKQVDGWITYTEQKNPNIDITYESIDMAGGPADRHAIIRNMRLKNTQVISFEDSENEPVTLVSTAVVPAAELHPQSAAFDQFKVRLAEPVGFFDGENAETKRMEISFDPAIEVDVKHIMEDDQNIIYYDQQLNGTVNVASFTETGEPQDNLEILFKEGSYSKGSFSADQRQRGDMEMLIKGMEATGGNSPDKAVIEEVSASASWRDFDKDQAALDAKYAIKNLSFQFEEMTEEKENLMEYLPMSMVLDFDYSGPSLDNPAEVDWVTTKALVNLDKLEVETAKAKLSANLHFQTGQGEMLPVGEGNVTLTNLPHILEQTRLNEEENQPQAQLAELLAQRVVGKPLNEIQDLSIDIKRETGQELKVGKASFQELFAIFLTGGQLPPPPGAEPMDQAEPLDEGEVEEMFDEQ